MKSLRSLPHHTHTHSLSHPHVLSFSLSLTHSVTHTPPSHTYSSALSFSRRSPSLSHTNLHTLSLTHMYIHMLSRVHTHTHTLSLCCPCITILSFLCRKSKSLCLHYVGVFLLLLKERMPPPSCPPGTVEPVLFFVCSLTPVACTVGYWSTVRLNFNEFTPCTEHLNTMQSDCKSSLTKW